MCIFQVLDSRGYVKLVDLGLAKQILSGSTWTMCDMAFLSTFEMTINVTTLILR